VAEALVLDTHPVLFYAGNDRRKLGRVARTFFEELEQGEGTGYVPAPVVMESGFLLKRGTIDHPLGLRSWWRAMERTGLIQVDLTAEDVLAAAELDWSHPDPFDRLIVATALRLGLPLLTRDAAIAEWGGVEVVW